jgi:hypothetical protein
MVKKSKKEAKQTKPAKKAERKTIDDNEIQKLLKITKLLKKDKVRVEETRLAPRTTNKWRSSNPNFAPKTEKPTNTVEAGGMQVDPSLQQEYENWRKDKIQEANERRESNIRRWKAAAEERRKQQGNP